MQVLGDPAARYGDPHCWKQTPIDDGLCFILVVKDDRRVLGADSCQAEAFVLTDGPSTGNDVAVDVATSAGAFRGRD